MAKYILTSVKGAGALNGKTFDLIVDGNHAYISKDSNTEGLEKKDGSEFFVSNGLCDLLADFGEPGNEFREDLESGRKAAINGGFSSVILNPLTNPVVDNKGAVRFIQGHSNKDLKLIPSACISQGNDAKNLAELLDLSKNGAQLFYDGLGNCNLSLLKKALLYSQKVDKPIVIHPHLFGYSESGMIHESGIGTTLGLKSTASYEEYSAVDQAIEILKYTGGKLHFHLISCKESLEKIAEAKKEGLQVTCSVAFYQLILNENIQESFDAHYKVWPVLRSESDRLSLIEGVKSGIIDIICSAHMPHDEEAKECEFGIADFGIGGIESCVRELHNHFGDNKDLWNQILIALSNSKEIFDYQKDNNDLFVFRIKDKATAQKQHFSLGKNNPFKLNTSKLEPLSV